MCGRYGLADPREVDDRFSAQQIPGLELSDLYVPRYNIAPTQDVLTVALSKRLAGGRAVKRFRWGLVAEWALKDRTKPRPINIKCESLLERPHFRRLLERKRCLIPADGFYEWQGTGKDKQPWSIGLASGELFAFAGVWDACRDEDGWLVSCAILTTRPNGVVAPIHDRMPIILRPELEELWLDPSVTEAEVLAECFVPLPEAVMDRYPVRALVNDVNNEGPELRRRVDLAPSQPTLI